MRRISTQSRLDNGVFPDAPAPPSPGYACEQEIEGWTEASDTYYCYDEFERLGASQGPGQDGESYVHDGLDRRDLKLTRDGGARVSEYSYVGTSESLAREQRPDGGAADYDYSATGERMGQRMRDSSSDEFHPYAKDANGSVEALEQDDGSIAEGDRYRYDPYGELETREAPDGQEQPEAEDELSPDARNNPFRFQGFYYDSAIKTYDMQAREYRPDVGRFLSADRFEAAGMDLALQSDPLTQNRYAFAGGNPVSRIEFDGHWACTGWECGSHDHGGKGGGGNRGGRGGGGSGGGGGGSSYSVGASVYGSASASAGSDSRGGTGGSAPVPPTRIEKVHRAVVTHPLVIGTIEVFQQDAIEVADERLAEGDLAGLHEQLAAYNDASDGECEGVSCDIGRFVFGDSLAETALTFGTLGAGTLVKGIAKGCARYCDNAASALTAGGNKRVVIGKQDALRQPAYRPPFSGRRPWERELDLESRKLGNDFADRMQNVTALREAMTAGRPIRDAHRSLFSGRLKDPISGSYLDLERGVLMDDAWRYSPMTRKWYPGG